MNCPNLSQIFAYRDKVLRPEDQEKITAHLRTCSKCQQLVKDYHQIEKILYRVSPTMDKNIEEECYDDFQLITYLEGYISRNSRAVYHKHFRQCHQCLNRLISLEDFFSELRSEGVIPEKRNLINHILNIKQNITIKIGELIRFPVVPKPGWRWALISIILIATVLFVVDYFKMPAPYNQTRHEISEEITLIYPKDKVESEDQIEFKWRASSPKAQYNFILINSQGNIVWEQQTSLTELKLPAELRLQPSETYFWQVEAFDSTGISILSEMKSFIYK